MAGRLAFTGWRLHLALLGVLILLLLAFGVGPRALCEVPGCHAVSSGSDTVFTGAGLPVRVELGSVPSVWPGTSVPIEMVIENPQPRPIRVSTVDLIIRGVRSAGSGGPRSGTSCPVSDFRATAGILDVVIDPGASFALAGSAIPPERWPQLVMLETGVNQDRCQRAQLQLAAQVRGRLL